MAAGSGEVAQEFGEQLDSLGVHHTCNSTSGQVDLQGGPAIASTGHFGDEEMPRLRPDSIIGTHSRSIGIAHLLPR